MDATTMNSYAGIKDREAAYPSPNVGSQSWNVIKLTPGGEVVPTQATIGLSQSPSFSNPSHCYNTQNRKVYKLGEVK